MENIKRKSNIVFILVDDMGSWALGSAGNSEIRTPHLDKLAAEGTRFDHFFCTSPVCSPARASIMTGRIPSQHGVHDWIRSGNVNRGELNEEVRTHLVFADERTAVDYLAGQPTYTELLAEAGYTCALSGKWHLGNNAVPRKGFERWFSIARGGCSYMKPDIVQDGEVKIVNEYVTDLITDHALQFLDELGRQESPFYLSVHYTAPHSPWNRSEHPESYVAMYDDCPFESVPELTPHPNQIRTAPHGEGERRKELLRGYYASITAMDDGIGKIMDMLEERGLREQTLVVFMGDNGMNMGHHGVWGKGNGTFPLNMYDTSVMVPAIFSQPGVIPAGRIMSELLSQYDVFPTLLDYVGLSNPEQDRLPGRSFGDLLRGETGAGREDIVIYDEYGPVRMIRTQDWKYVHRYPYGPHELYDLRNDPNEDANRVDDSECQEVLEALRFRLGEWFGKYVIPGKDGISAPVTGFGQMSPLAPGVTEGGAFKPLAK
ncbi:sulfatase-like hydrolase/transferase [Paenibacillus filicis]|uniref:Sulfatase-like hydrolase/transferase n=1 Tax=Paenibacillus gyeongsangnamensis TaxID=3388067 RepID=A0ABT4Q289_9BACL|nr:sulfatase-like hydrolase/transferase [Paenibacillus filicis]MCZ8510986.1 sulfatase-like hydrolase/transferase [Paenibacillus filicis]